MADILGIVGSARRWGNSDLLVRQALLGAQAEGATVKAVRLTDLSSIVVHRLYALCRGRPPLPPR